MLKELSMPFCDLTVFVDLQYQIPKKEKKKKNKILLLTFIQGQDVGMVILRHGDNGLPGESCLSALVYCVSADAWGGGASPVNCVPGTVISQALNRTHIYRNNKIAWPCFIPTGWDTRIPVTWKGDLIACFSWYYNLEINTPHAFNSWIYSLVDFFNNIKISFEEFHVFTKKMHRKCETEQRPFNTVILPY